MVTAGWKDAGCGGCVECTRCGAIAGRESIAALKLGCACERLEIIEARLRDMPSFGHCPKCLREVAPGECTRPCEHCGVLMTHEYGSGLDGALVVHWSVR